MAAQLRALRDNPQFTTPARPTYLRTQQLVLDGLDRVAGTAAAGNRDRALAIVRAEVQPNERAASRIAHTLITQREQEGRRCADGVRALERQALIAGSMASLILYPLAAVATLVLILRTVVRPLSDIEHVLGRVAEGDTAHCTPHVDWNDEIGRMAGAIDVFRSAALDRERLRAESERARTGQVLHGRWNWSRRNAAPSRRKRRRTARPRRRLPRLKSG